MNVEKRKLSKTVPPVSKLFVHRIRIPHSVKVVTTAEDDFTGLAERIHLEFSGGKWTFPQPLTLEIPLWERAVLSDEKVRHRVFIEGSEVVLESSDKWHARRHVESLENALKSVTKDHHFQIYSVAKVKREESDKGKSRSLYIFDLGPLKSGRSCGFTLMRTDFFPLLEFYGTKSSQELVGKTFSSVLSDPLHALNLLVLESKNNGYFVPLGVEQVLLKLALDLGRLRLPKWIHRKVDSYTRELSTNFIFTRDSEGKIKIKKEWLAEFTKTIVTVSKGQVKAQTKKESQIKQEYRVNLPEAVYLLLSSRHSSKRELLLILCKDTWKSFTCVEILS